MKSMMILGVSVVLLIHLGAGHSASYIAKDFASGAILLIGGMIAIFFLSTAKQLQKIPIYIWHRNRKATIIAQKVNGLEKLTESEKIELDRFLDQGILSPMPYTYRKQLHLHVKLSNDALNDVLRY